MKENGETEAGVPGGRAAARWLGAWVGWVRRFAWLVMVVTLASTAAAGWWAVTVMKINTDTTDLVDRTLAPLKAYDDYKLVFPQFSDNIVVVVEGASGDAATDAARALARAMRAEPKVFGAVFYPQGDAFFRKNGLLYLDLPKLEAMAGRLAAAQPLLAALAQDPSLRGFAGVMKLSADNIDRLAGQEAQVAGLDGALTGMAAAIDAVLGGRYYRLSWSDLLRGDKDGASRRVIVVQPALDYTSLQPAAAAMKRIRALAGVNGVTDVNGLRVRLTGGAAMRSEELKSVESGMGLAGILTAVSVFVLLLAGLRSFRLMFAALVTLIVGLAWTGVFAAAAIGHLTLISVAFAVLFIGLGVDFSIHYVLRYQEGAEALDAGRERHGLALRHAAQNVGGALTLCAVTAAIGFFSFLPTAYRGVSELGLISGAGMFIALACTFTVLPAMLTVLPGRAAANPGLSFLRVRDLSTGATAWVRAHAPRIVGGVAILSIGAAILATGVRFDFDPLNLRDPGSESVATLRDLVEKEGRSAYDAVLLARNLEEADRIAAKLRRLPTVKSVVTLSAFQPRDIAEKLAVIEGMALVLTPVLIEGGGAARPTPAGNRAALVELEAALKAAVSAGKGGPLAPKVEALRGKLARFLLTLSEDPAAAEARLAALETALLANFKGRIGELRDALNAAGITLADVPEDLRGRYLAKDGRARIEINPRGDLGDNAARREFVRQLRTIAPGVTGGAVLTQESGAAITSSFKTAGAIAFVAIFLLLALILRDVWDVMLILVPLLLAGLFTMAATVVFGLAFNFANVIVLPLLLGLGVASAIHLVMRERQSAQTGDGDGDALLTTSTPRAVLFSALTTTGSFASLGTSSHPGTASMGILLTIAILMTLVFTLVVLPAMIELRRRGRR